MELLILSFPLAYWLFQIDFLPSVNSGWLLVFLLLAIARYFFLKGKLSHIFKKKDRIYITIINCVILLLFCILWQVIIDGIQGIPFGDGILFVYSLLNIFGFSIPLIPIVLISMGIFLRKKDISWSGILLYLFSPILFVIKYQKNR